MKNPFRIPRLDTEEKFILTGKVIAIGCIVVAALGITVPLALGEPSLALLGSYLAIPMLIAPLVFLRTASDGADGGEFRLENHLFPLLVLIFSVLFSFSILTLGAFPLRNPFYYLLVTGMGVCILLEILQMVPSGPQIRIILAQMVVLYLNIDWGVTFKYFFFIGRTDPLGHTWLLTNLLQEGHITAVFSEYQQFPLWHILCAMGYYLSGILVTSRQLMYLLNGLVFVVVIGMVYLIARGLMCDERVGLLAALFTVFNSGIIAYGMTSIPRSAVLLLILCLIYLLLTLRTRIHVVLIMLLTLSTIMFHTVSMPFIVLIFLVILLLQEVYQDHRKQGFLRFPYLVMMMVMTLVYWMFFASYLFRIVVFDILQTAPSRLAISGALDVPLTELFNYLQYLPLLLFLIVGVLAVLPSTRYSFPMKIFCLTGLLMVPAVFPGPALLIGKLASNFNLSRFEEYAFLFISLSAAVGFVYLVQRLGRKGRVAVILLFAVMCMLTVSNDFVASDNPLVKRPFYTYYLTRAEFTGFDRLVPVTEGLVLTDYVTERYYMNSPYRQNATILQVDITTSRFIRNESTDTFLIRNRELQGRPLKLLNSRTGIFVRDPDFTGTLEYYPRDSPVWARLDRFRKVYDSEWVEAYQ